MIFIFMLLSYPATDPCNPSPCLNNGQCTTVSAIESVCNCPASNDYIGERCEICKLLLIISPFPQISRVRDQGEFPINKKVTLSLMTTQAWGSGRMGTCHKTLVLGAFGIGIRLNCCAIKLKNNNNKY